MLPGGLPGSVAHPMPSSTHSSPHMGWALSQLTGQQRERGPGSCCLIKARQRHWARPAMPWGRQRCPPQPVSQMGLDVGPSSPRALLSPPCTARPLEVLGTFPQQEASCSLSSRGPCVRAREMWLVSPVAAQASASEGVQKVRVATQISKGHGLNSGLL